MVYAVVGQKVGMGYVRVDCSIKLENDGRRGRGRGIMVISKA
jgi:hypothetical protein